MDPDKVELIHNAVACIIRHTVSHVLDVYKRQASIWSSGKITCTGATSEDQSKIAARRFARCLQKLGFKTRFTNFRVVNVLGTCSMPFAIKINAFSEQHKDIAE